MAILLIVSITVCVIAQIFAIFMFFRNGWVFNHRIWVIDYNYDDYDKYWSYDKMMYHFWIWDIEKMRDDK